MEITKWLQWKKGQTTFSKDFTKAKPYGEEPFAQGFSRFIAGEKCPVPRLNKVFAIIQDSLDKLIAADRKDAKELRDKVARDAYDMDYVFSDNIAEAMGRLLHYEVAESDIAQSESFGSNDANIYRKAADKYEHEATRTIINRPVAIRGDERGNGGYSNEAVRGIEGEGGGNRGRSYV